ncbi:ubiquinone/menaquinone biosynthesis methyltransferase [Actinoplanes philippinensis]|uniref:Ubiquinone/menaquinone biosynthesis C-methylase UbiE n=1 Tax=Actinoplanes philippinensis TaxID=35752 RepID=A0A1I2E0P2_9ACTN|nr:class I SAM-dependent methyltransferase [Actinoplanes philippinensis]GIE77351.1 ubiquinone/menaquinone biosynthesis methyltransferase [Actinoplanes philippinensis]SFE86237.1 Ubiquinone/menaquinone biosynthesis C-methylase UbiE [Actinoplanes philippinensis]
MEGSDGAAKARRVWDKAAPSYDRQIALPERFWFTGGREWLGSRVVGRVLDVGVGTGRNLPYFPAAAPEAGKTAGTIAGVDVSPGMLAFARERAADLGLAVDLREADAARLPFADASFDTIVCALSLCAIADPRAAITEMRRVLAPGGRLLLFDHVASTWPPVYALQWVIERFSVPAAGEHFTRRQLPLVRDAGFEVVETVRRRAGTIELVHAVKAAPVQG